MSCSAAVAQLTQLVHTVWSCANVCGMLCFQYCLMFSSHAISNIATGCSCSLSCPCSTIKQVVEGPPKVLQEAVIEEMANKLLCLDPRVSAVQLYIRKPQVALHGVLDSVGKPQVAPQGVLDSVGKPQVALQGVLDSVG